MEIRKDSVLEKTILFEMSGKNQAIHEYDSMIWKLRISYLGLFFGIWALLFNKMLDNGAYGISGSIIDLMRLLGYVIAGGAFFIDMNYVIRKHKVVLALNRLYSIICDIEVKDYDYLKIFNELLVISGTKSRLFKKKKGMRLHEVARIMKEINICVIVYLVPLILMITGFRILF